MKREINSLYFHYTGDLVMRQADGVIGDVLSHTNLYAVVRWSDGEEVEVEQGGPAVILSIKAHDREGARPWEPQELQDARQELADLEEELAGARAALEEAEQEVDDIEWEIGQLEKKIRDMERGKYTPTAKAA